MQKMTVAKIGFCAFLGLATAIDASVASDWHGSFRYQLQNDVLSSSTPTARERMSLQLGKKWDINPNTSFELGLSTGGVNGRSRYQVLGESGAFANAGVVLTSAALRYRVSDALTVVAGKFKNPFYSTSELLWDADLSVEGVALNYGVSPKQGWGMVHSLGSLTMMPWEVSGVTGAKLFAYQNVVTYKQENYNAKVSLSYYLFNSVKGKSLTSGGVASGVNNSTASGLLLNDYRPLVLSAESSMMDWMGFPKMTLFADGVLNPDVSDQLANKGGLIGVRVGSKDTKKEGGWATEMNYRVLQHDAWLDIFPDSSAFRGRTGIKGLNLVSQYAVADDVVVRAKAYFMETLIEADASRPSNTELQFDITVGF